MPRGARDDSGLNGEPRPKHQLHAGSKHSPPLRHLIGLGPGGDSHLIKLPEPTHREHKHLVDVHPHLLLRDH